MSLAGQIQAVFGCVDVAVPRQRQLDDVVVLLPTKQYADRWPLEVLFDVTVKVIDVHLHLSQILVTEFPGLQVDEDIALQKPIVEHQIDKERLFVKGEPLLARLKQKAPAKFEQECLQIGDDGREIGYTNVKLYQAGYPEWSKTH